MAIKNRWLCPNCAKPYRIPPGAEPPAVCPACEKAIDAKRASASDAELVIDPREQAQLALEAAAAQVLLSTSNRLDGHQVQETVQLVAAERVSVVYSLKDLVVGVTERASDRAGKVEAEMKKLRESCLKGLRCEAVKCGANAVIAVQFTCTELSAARSLPMIMMTALGTAARVAPSEAAD